MSARVEDDYPDVVEHGYFAGTEMESLPELRFGELEAYIYDVCAAEADKMYKSLEQSYEEECEYMREQAIENIKESEAERLQEVLLLLPSEANKSTFEEALDEAGVEDIDFEDLEVLGFVKHKERGIYELRR